MMSGHQMLTPSRFQPRKRLKRIHDAPAIGPASQRAPVRKRAMKTTLLPCNWKNVLDMIVAPADKLKIPAQSFEQRLSASASYEKTGTVASHRARDPNRIERL